MTTAEGKRSSVVDAYLRRLGVSREPPSVDALVRLHHAHVERVPYETFWIHQHERWTIDGATSLRRIARGRRGGYCYMLNGAFANLLTALGYRVTRHVASVHGADGPSARGLGNHVALIVDGLPDEASPGGRWYVDVGLGDALHSPLPLRPVVDHQGPNRFELTRVEPGGLGDWHLERDAAGTFAGVSIVESPVALRPFLRWHRYNSTSPESGFVRTVTAQLRFAEGTSVLRGCVHTRVRDATISTYTCESLPEWRTLLADEFGLTFDMPLDDVWVSVRSAHEEWLAAATS